jgi:hypothetical protein
MFKLKTQTRMKTFFMFFSLSCLLTAGLQTTACDHHQYKSSVYTWHTRTFQPLLDKISTGKLTADEAFSAAVKTVNSQGPHLNEAYTALGLDSVQKLDIPDLYQKRKGKPFVLNATVVKYLDDLKQIRNQKQYTANSADDFAALRLKMHNTETDKELGEALSTIILLFEESGTFWDIALNDFPLGPKSKQSVRRDTWDATNFSNYYFALRELGLDNDAAQAIAMVETACAAMLCKDCGVW